MHEKRLVLFGRPGCGKCDSIKNMLAFKLPKWGMFFLLVFHDIDTAEGMAQAACYDVLKPPVLLIMEGDTILTRFDDIPTSDALKAALS